MKKNSIIRIEILNVPVDAVNMQQAVNWCDQVISEPSMHPQSIVAVNPEKVIKAKNDRTLLNLLKNSGLLIPDGIGVVIAASLLKLGKMSRVPGSELMPNLCKLAADKRYKIFLFGGSEQVNQKVERNLVDQYPNINIVGRCNGFVSDSDMHALIETINRSNAQILFLALGSPKQELWMEKHLDRLTTVKICQGVGGTFDVIAGNVRRAPLFFRKIYLEWFYRLVSQPKRLMRQKALPQFAYQIIQQKYFS